MDVKAILVVEGTSEAGSSSGSAAAEMAGVPMAFLDVLGRPVLHRVADRLRRFGVSGISVVSGHGSQAAGPARRAMRADLQWTNASGASFWRTTENVFGELAQENAEAVLVLRVGPYAEIDFEELIQFHLDQHSRVTTVHDGSGEGLDIFVISASRRNDAAFLFRHQLTQCRVPAAPYVFSGYQNRLRNCADLRRLAADALMLRAEIPPDGEQVKPGVWVASGARLQRGARVLAPAYIGAGSKVRSAAVITRGSVLEHHCEVDCGTVVENSTLLPYSYVGAGLDVAHSVVGFKRLVSVHRNVEVEFTDPRLVGMASEHAPLRALLSAASLAAFLPTQVFRGLLSASHRQQPTTLPQAVTKPATALKSPALQEPAVAPDPDFQTNFAVMRRYGNE